jgi:cytochrome c peroxidase
MAELIRHHFAGSNTLWDLYLKGRKEVLSERMKRGGVLFHTKANCVFCHNGNLFTNFSLENIGIPQIGADDRGAGNYRFRVPPLRNVGVTAPYMHSGVYKTLAEVIDHYDDPVGTLRNFKWNPRHPNYNGPLNLDTDSVRNDNRERTLSRMLARNLELDPEEKKDLICFLAVALTDVSLQQDLISKGVVNEISDCSPRPY